MVLHCNRNHAEEYRADYYYSVREQPYYLRIPLKIRYYFYSKLYRHGC